MQSLNAMPHARRTETDGDTVDVWTLDVAAVDVSPETCARDLAAEEQGRAARFRHPADRASFVAAHRLLRAALGARLGLAPIELRFTAALGGKPHLDLSAPGTPPDAVPFNLSHARGVVACAVGGLMPVGVDVERVRSAEVADELQGRVLHPSERAHFLNGPADERAAAFFRIWALKEAYIKATGEGLTAPLREIAFHPEHARLDALPEGRDPSAWTFAHRFFNALPTAEVRPPRISQAVCVARGSTPRWRTSADALELLEDHR